jgi:hypothetical protein
MLLLRLTGSFIIIVLTVCFVFWIVIKCISES